MKKIEIGPVSTETVSITKFLRWKREGKLINIHVEGIVPKKFGSAGAFGGIRIRRETPVYRPL